MPHANNGHLKRMKKKLPTSRDERDSWVVMKKVELTRKTVDDPVA